MIQLAEHAAGLLLSVRAQPGARSSGIRGEHNGALKLAVMQVAEKGKANEALQAVLADGLGLKRSQVELVSGATARNKQFLIRGITRAGLEQRIAQALEARE